MHNGTNMDPGGKQTKPIWIMLILSIILIFISLGFWYWYAKYYKTAEQDNSQSISQSMLSSTQTALSFVSEPDETENEVKSQLDDENLNIYDNRAYGYTIKYPSDWSAIGTDDLESQNVYFASSKDMLDGVIVSVALFEEHADYENIKNWIESLRMGNQTDATFNDNTTYVKNEENDIVFAKTESLKFNLITYHWICGGNIMALSYTAADDQDYQTYLPIFESIFNSLIPCAG